jgi:hypothetical protein
MMIHSRSLETRCAFYHDPEICTLSDSSERLSQLDGICTYPSPEYGAYATSLPADFSDPQFTLFDAEPDALPATSLSDVVQSSGNLNSPEVAAFWKLYQAYPKHLKAIEKRKKRKTKKRISSDAPDP